MLTDNIYTCINVSVDSRVSAFNFSRTPQNNIKWRMYKNSHTIHTDYWDHSIVSDIIDTNYREWY